MLQTLMAWLRWGGRLRRRSFFWMSLACSAAFVVGYVFLERSVGHASTLILYPPFFAVQLSLAVRRLHDQARSGWWLLAVLIPILGPLLIAVLLLLRRGTAGENQYGDDPTVVGRDYLKVAVYEQS